MKKNPLKALLDTIKSGKPADRKADTPKLPAFAALLAQFEGLYHRGVEAAPYAQELTDRCDIELDLHDEELANTLWAYTPRNVWEAEIIVRTLELIEEKIETATPGVGDEPTGHASHPE